MSDAHVDLEEYFTTAPGDAGRPEMEAHVAACEDCRAEVESLAMAEHSLTLLSAEPEFALEGPPDGADLLLQRTLRQVRTESSRKRFRGRTLAVVAAAVVAAAAAGIGVLATGSDSGGTPTAAPPPSSQAPNAPGTKFASGTDPGTNARLTVGVTPAAGWVRVNASVTGIPAGEQCLLLVINKEGQKQIAGGWLVSQKSATEGTNLDGSALVDPSDVAAVVVENTSGKRFVTANL